MSARSKRVPQALGDASNRIYLTLLADADSTGLVTQCTWTKIMDYAAITRKTEAEQLVRLLAENSLVAVINVGSRSPHFRMLGDFTTDLPAARAFYASNMERVNSLRNTRSSAHSQTRQGRSVEPRDFDVSIESLKELEPPDKDKAIRQWRFSVRVSGYGLVRNCFCRTYPHRAAFIKGAAVQIKDHWMDIVEFEPSMTAKITALVVQAIAQSETPTATSLK